MSHLYKAHYDKSMIEYTEYSIEFPYDTTTTIIRLDIIRYTYTRHSYCICIMYYVLCIIMKNGKSSKLN